MNDYTSTPTPTMSDAVDEIEAMGTEEAPETAATDLKPTVIEAEGPRFEIESVVATTMAGVFADAPSGRGGQSTIAHAVKLFMKTPKGDEVYAKVIRGILDGNEVDWDTHNLSANQALIGRAVLDADADGTILGSRPKKGTTVNPLTVGKEVRALMAGIYVLEKRGLKAVRKLSAM